MNDDVFEYTGNGQSVPNDVVSVRFHPSVIKVDDEAFYRYRMQDCCELKEVVLNDGLKIIGYRAFSGCSSLQSITLPSTVIQIRPAAFYECIKLREVVLNEGLQKIEGSAFEGCKSLQIITLPSTVMEIGNHAFQHCHWLQSITLPSSLVEIGKYGFNACIKLKEVVCSEVLPNVESTTFSDCRALERFTFPNISSRLEAIIQAGQVDVQNKIKLYINRGGIERKREGLYIPVEVTRRRTGWSLVQQNFRQIVKWIKYYELREATTLFELALWKAKMDQQVVEEDDDNRDRKKAKIDQAGDTDRHDDRDSFRVDVPGPVKDAILQYLR